MQSPHTYGDWANTISELLSGEHDEEVLQSMKAGTIQWQTGVAERFTTLLSNAINSRINSAIDKFQKETSRTGASGATMIQGLLALRRELAFLLDVVDLPALPEEYRNAFCELVRSSADKLQSSLEDSAKSDRSGQLSSIVRNHKINNI
jgi:hypothetical protein